MEREFEQKVELKEEQSNGVARSRSFAFRAPQESFTVVDFELGKLYGVGSYSKVVRAKKKDTGKVCALKIMDKKFIAKENKIPYIKMERIVLDQLDHPGIIRLLFTFQDTYSLYMALESCDGGELFDQITRKGRLSEDEARYYAAEVIDALEYLHGVGLIHRDIKPENLLLTSDGHIKIADFGSVKPMSSCKINVLQTTSGDEKACSFVGTAAYVPPEVLNSCPASLGNDMWALGCTLYQMLSGTSPFKGASEWLIFQSIIARDLKFPDYFSPEAKDLIDKLLDIDPNKRPGAGPDGYAALKSHPFFNRVDWSNLRRMCPPKLAPELQVSEECDVQDCEWGPSHVGDGSSLDNATHDGIGGATTSAKTPLSMARLASIDSFDSKWQQFLDPGESVVMISMVKKVQKLKNKKVQLILTDKPKLMYVDPSKLVVKGNLIWSHDPKDFNVQMKKVVCFEDTKERAWQWKNAIETLQKH